MVARRPFVLIVSNRRDAHVPLVSKHLDRLEVPYWLLDTESFGGEVVGSIHIADQADASLRTSQETIRLDDVTAVWYRRPETPSMSAIVSPDARQFAQEEEKSFMEGLLSQLSCRWLSRPAAIREAGHKLLQLRVAKNLGFDVPPTLVSQSPEEIRNFRAAVGKPLAAKLIGKGPPRTATPEEQYVIFTQVLNDSDLSNDAALGICAALYQPYIEKDFELRVTVIGDEVFACRIESQASPRTRVDWRRYDLENTPHSAYDLDEATRQRCLDLVRHFGLGFGAIDLIVTPSGEVVFLEINPNGQWGWIEEITELPIGLAHARFLAEP